MNSRNQPSRLNLLACNETDTRILGGEGRGTIIQPDARGGGGTRIIVQLVMVSRRSRLRA